LSQDLIETFTDVGRSWLKKIVRTVITSAASEAGLNLVIEPPSDKKILFVSVGVSEKEVKDRMMKLKVRAKAVVDALVAASKNSQLAPPKPLCSFLQRISSDGVYVMTPFLHCVFVTSRPGTILVLAMSTELCSQSFCGPRKKSYAFCFPIAGSNFVFCHNLNARKFACHEPTNHTIHSLPHFHS
jgi:hypothetical protein